MKVTFLGTNGWYTTEMGNTPCVLIESKDYYIVLDAGNGIYRLDEYIKEEKPIYLFLSHLHLDHSSGLHYLPKFRFKQGLKIYLQSEKENALEILVNHPYAMPFKDLPFKVEIFGLFEGEQNLPFKVTAKKLNHMDESFGYRFEIDSQVLTYVTDTGYSENTILLSKDADLLIHECTFLPGMEKNDWGHTTPQLTAKIAKEANVKKLVLFHFQPDFYPTFAKREEAQKLAQEIFPNTISAKDGMEIIL